MTLTMRTWSFGGTDEYPPGPWTAEPDKCQWIDGATDLDCLIVRGPVGSLCGYVGVPPGNPWHGKDYSEIDGDVDAHGGLTFSGPCQEGEADGPHVCHVPEPGRPSDVWWFGFDCAHYNDIAPGLIAILEKVGGRVGQPYFPGRVPLETYKTIGYVRDQCAALAAQLSAARSV